MASDRLTPPSKEADEAALRDEFLNQIAYAVEKLGFDEPPSLSTTVSVPRVKLDDFAYNDFRSNTPSVIVVSDQHIESAKFHGMLDLNLTLFSPGELREAEMRLPDIEYHGDLIAIKQPRYYAPENSGYTPLISFGEDPGGWPGVLVAVKHPKNGDYRVTGVHVPKGWKQIIENGRLKGVRTPIRPAEPVVEPPAAPATPTRDFHSERTVFSIPDLIAKGPASLSAGELNTLIAANPTRANKYVKDTVATFPTDRSAGKSDFGEIVRAALITPTNGDEVAARVKDTQRGGIRLTLTVTTENARQFVAKSEKAGLDIASELRSDQNSTGRIFVDILGDYGSLTVTAVAGEFKIGSYKEEESGKTVVMHPSVFASLFAALKAPQTSQAYVGREEDYSRTDRRRWESSSHSRREPTFYAASPERITELLNKPQKPLETDIYQIYQYEPRPKPSPKPTPKTTTENNRGESRYGNPTSSIERRARYQKKKRADKNTGKNRNKK